LKKTITPADVPVFDPGVIADINRHLGEARNIGAQLVQTFTSSATRHLERIQAALVARDDKAAARSAHALKGGAVTIGLSRLAHTCAHIERRLSADDAAATVDDKERAMFAREIRHEHDRALEALASLPG
jgi:HPt (histidine-containing phosphotransfer) domain-containing protein